MPTIDFVELGTIVITVIVGGVIGYAIHWLQTRNQRSWKKLDEVHKTAMRFVQGVQLSMLKTASILQVAESGKLTQNGGYTEIVDLTFEQNQFSVDLSMTSVMKDTKLSGFYQEIIDKYAECVVSFETLDDVEKTRDLIHKTVVEISEVGTQIDERFEQLKSKIW